MESNQMQSILVSSLQESRYWGGSTPFLFVSCTWEESTESLVSSAANSAFWQVVCSIRPLALVGYGSRNSNGTHPELISETTQTWRISLVLILVQLTGKLFPKLAGILSRGLSIPVRLNSHDNAEN